MARASAWRRRGLIALTGLFCASGPAAAAEIQPHRAIYDLVLAQAKPSSGITDAKGSMLVEWADSCDGWTIDQRYHLSVSGEEPEDSQIAVSYSTWESKDGLSYRFFIRKLRDGDMTEQTRGRSKLTGPGEGGEAVFTQPEANTIDLPRGVMFPTDHALLLIGAAERGERFVGRKVFDGGEVDGATEVTAVIGRPTAPAADAKPLLKRRGWPMRLAFYRPESSGSEPDYEVGMKMLDNGVAESMTLDYGDLVVRARLREIEAIAPTC